MGTLRQKRDAGRRATAKSPIFPAKVSYIAGSVSVDPDALMLKAKNLPVQEVKEPFLGAADRSSGDLSPGHAGRHSVVAAKAGDPLCFDGGIAP